MNMSMTTNTDISRAAAFYPTHDRNIFSQEEFKNLFANHGGSLQAAEKIYTDRFNSNPTVDAVTNDVIQVAHGNLDQYVQEMNAQFDQPQSNGGLWSALRSLLSR